MKSTLFLFALINGIAFVFFTASYFLAPANSKVDCQMRFRQLDESGLINRNSVPKIATAIGLSSAPQAYRVGVPNYMISASVSVEETFAIVAAISCAVNCILYVVIYLLIPSANKARAIPATECPPSSELS